MREQVERGIIEFVWVLSEQQLAAVLTKADVTTVRCNVTQPQADGNAWRGGESEIWRQPFFQAQKLKL